MCESRGLEYVCARCFYDDELKAFVDRHAESNECDFCGNRSREPIAAPLSDVAAHIFNCIGVYFDDPANAGLPFETAEGGYQGETFSTDEVFEEVELYFPGDSGVQLRDAIIAESEIDLWSAAEPFRLSEKDRLRYSWERFCAIIKHRRRYFFHQHERDPYDDEIYGPSEVLDAILSCAKQSGAIVELAPGTTFFRARSEAPGDCHRTASSLGPPPEDRALQTNRMSPPGIVMMYVGDDQRTALAETASEPGTYAVGEFITERSSVILDLTKLPPIPSIFGEYPYDGPHNTPEQVAFLHAVSAEISKPIARDDRVHIEYVPTQVVTEYVRSMVNFKGRSIDGIRYKSSRLKTGTAVVLFVDGSNLILEEDERPKYYSLAKDRWIRLIAAKSVQVTKKTIASWNEGISDSLFF